MGKLSREFHHLFQSRLRTVSAFLCTIPSYWCLLYKHFRKPILGVMDQPIFLFVPPALRPQWLLQFRELAQDSRNLFVCHTAFLQEQVAWQTGLRLPVARYLAVKTDRWRWRPGGEAARAALVVTQPTTRPYFLPLLRRFQEANPGLFSELVGLEEVPSWREGRSDRYKRLAEHRAAIIFPYDVHFVKLLELYSMGIPIFLPSDFYMWAFTWTISDSSVMEDDLAASFRAKEGDPERTDWEPWRHPYPPHCATVGLRHLHPKRCAYWASFSDLARLPHMEYFDSLPDLLMKLRDVDDEETSTTTTSTTSTTTTSIKTTTTTTTRSFSGAAGPCGAFRPGQLERW
ncbi:unnamed protein product [Polarella glacialis]|uniref:Uncharacterized protein n=1 Tax=Polarella glacialis TaxID=89957 RepID=A0A813D9Q4_POLGL|nr:unnamed protein product [Polarella glacialis]